MRGVSEEAFWAENSYESRHWNEPSWPIRELIIGPVKEQWEIRQGLGPQCLRDKLQSFMEPHVAA